MKNEMKHMIKSQKTQKWTGDLGPADQNRFGGLNQGYNANDSQNLQRASYRSSNHPYGMRGPAVGNAYAQNEPQNQMQMQA